LTRKKFEVGGGDFDEAEVGLVAEGFDEALHALVFRHEQHGAACEEWGEQSRDGEIE